MQHELLECAFLIPVRRDKNLSDGKPHQPKLWRWLRDELYSRFGGWTLSPGLHEGAYVDPDTGAQVTDKSWKYSVALPRKQLGQLRAFLAEACVVFHQKSIYLSVGGLVEFVENPDARA